MSSEGPKDSGSPLPGSEAAWLTHLPTLIRSLWDEVCQAFAAGSFTLVAHGTRTLVGRVAQDLVGESGTYAQTLDALYEHGDISRRDRERLAVAVEVGNAAAHRQLNVQRNEARTLVRIIQVMLQNAYLPEEDVDFLRSIIPPRLPPKR